MKTSHTQLCVPNFMAALVAVIRKWEQPKCPSPDEWINKGWYIHTMKCYLATERTEILIHAITIFSMNLENIMWSEKTQSQNTIRYMKSFI